MCPETPWAPLNSTGHSIRPRPTALLGGKLLAGAAMVAFHTRTHICHFPPGSAHAVHLSHIFCPVLDGVICKSGVLGPTVNTTEHNQTESVRCLNPKYTQQEAEVGVRASNPRMPGG